MLDWGLELEKREMVSWFELGSERGTEFEGEGNG